MTTAFHHGADLGSTAYEPLDWPIERIRERTLSYTFRPHFHPYVGPLVHRLVTDSIDGLQGADTEDVTRPDGTVVTLPDGSPKPVLYQDLMTARRYGPTQLVSQPYPVADLDFSTSGGYAVYNWELFFHLPLTVAIHLSRNGRYEEAQRWFHYVFDPTDDSDGPPRSGSGRSARSAPPTSSRSPISSPTCPPAPTRSCLPTRSPPSPRGPPRRFPRSRWPGTGRARTWSRP
jgi:hypothetical protein